MQGLRGGGTTTTTTNNRCQCVRSLRTRNLRASARRAAEINDMFYICSSRSARPINLTREPCIRGHKNTAATDLITSNHSAGSARARARLLGFVQASQFKR